APMKVHKAGFHPTAVFGVMGAVAGIGAALRLPAKDLVNAFGIAGSMAGGIIEYLADGSWTKRMHPGWAAQSGYRAVRLAMGGWPATLRGQIDMPLSSARPMPSPQAFSRATPDWANTTRLSSRMRPWSGWPAR